VGVAGPVGVANGVTVDVGVAVSGVSVGVPVGVFVGVSVGVFVGVFVGVSVGVFVAVGVAVFVGVFVAVGVAVFVAVAVGVGVAVTLGCAPTGPAAQTIRSAAAAADRTTRSHHPSIARFLPDPVPPCEVYPRTRAFAIDRLDSAGPLFPTRR